MSVTITFTNQIDLPVIINYWTDYIFYSIYKNKIVEPNEEIFITSSCGSFSIDCMFTDDEKTRQWMEQYNDIYKHGYIGTFYELPLSKKFYIYSNFEDYFLIKNINYKFTLIKSFKSL